MADSPESASAVSNATENDSDRTALDVHPLAFTIEFTDQKVDETRKSKVHERLSALSLKHRRNPSLPDFGTVKNAKNNLPSFNSHVPSLSKGVTRSGKPSEIQWKSSALKAVKGNEVKSPIVARKNFEEMNGLREGFLKHLKNGRRNSLNDMEDRKQSDVERKLVKTNTADDIDDFENKSDTVSEAGTYTVDKEENPDNDANRTCTVENEEVNGYTKTKKVFQSSWINDWVRDVEEQNMLNPVQKEHLADRHSGSSNSSPSASKIPSPIHTLSRKIKARNNKAVETKHFPVRVNGSSLHRRSSSLSAKDYNGSESSLETESFLRTTESVMTAMQNRMGFSLDSKNMDFRKTDRKDFNYKEKPHPPSTASDTDTNSEADTKVFKKPIGNPFTSARLNRAFSLRRAKADPSKDAGKKKASPISNETESKQSPSNSRGAITATTVPKTPLSKPPSSTPFSRIDCGRFSMRTLSSSSKFTVNGQNTKKEVKKTNNSNRSASSLSSREVEFQNWRRRKSFDPMKAAAEGRKKELAKKAAMNQSMTQSVSIGNSTKNRSVIGNPVLRSASFHSTVRAFDGENEEVEEDQGSTDEQEESTWTSNRRILTGDSNQAYENCNLLPRIPVFNSRSSLVSESQSSPSRRLRSDDLDNLVLSAINEVSSRLKLKSCNLLKKLNCRYEPEEEKSFRLRDEIAVLESRRNSAKNSPIHQSASKDLSTTLKNLKAVENVFKLLDDILFEESLEMYVNE